MVIQHDKCSDATWLKCKQVLSTLNQKTINYYLFFIANPPTMSSFSGLRKNKNTCCRFHICLLFPKGGLMRRFNLLPIFLSCPQCSSHFYPPSECTLYGHIPAGCTTLIWIRSQEREMVQQMGASIVIMTDNLATITYQNQTSDP